MIAGHIEDLIHAAKEMPNSESKNRGLSHLKDALAHFKVMEYESQMYADPSKLASKILESHVANGGVIKDCTCPSWPHAMAADCPLHGNK